MKADLNDKAVKAFGCLFAIQHANRLGLDPCKLHDQEIALACGVALFFLCDDYVRYAPNQEGLVLYPQETFKGLSEGAIEFLKKDIPDCNITQKEVFKCLFKGGQKLDIIHKHPLGQYFVDRNFINYYADAVNTMPDFCYGDC
ncbi:TPA: hypothetical protein JHW86_004190 [Escherichia coli]|nr:hypothetical protein [Escherichia coli]